MNGEKYKTARHRCLRRHPEQKSSAHENPKTGEVNQKLS